MCKKNKPKYEPQAQNRSLYYAGTADHVNNSLDKIIK